jgi:hypothetical protein
MAAGSGQSLRRSQSAQEQREDGEVGCKKQE